MNTDDLLIIENLAAFEKLINKDKKLYDINMMVMPGTFEDMHKDANPVKGIRACEDNLTL